MIVALYLYFAFVLKPCLIGWHAYVLPTGDKYISWCKHCNHAVILGSLRDD